MPKNYLNKFIRYVKKVYHIEEVIKSLTHKTKSSLYTTGEGVHLLSKVLLVN